MTDELKPSEVIVDFGAFKGTVRKHPKYYDCFRVYSITENNGLNYADIPLYMLDPETSKLVESLLKAQEE